MNERRSFVFVGLSITSSWGNGHATTYRGLLRELSLRGHEVAFLERDLAYYAKNRDLPEPPYCPTYLYGGLDELGDRFERTVRDADVVVVGSYVPYGAAVARWVLDTARGVTAFYDIDTPVTMHALERGGAEYLTPDLVGRFDLYLSFTGGPTLRRLERRFGAKRARPLYCSVDPALYRPQPATKRWDLGYLGTYSEDRQPALERLLVIPAERMRDRRFALFGAQFPASIDWPKNVERKVHLSPADHCAFYNAQRFTLNVTRRAMREAGFSPSVRLFEAAACATPILTDAWPGLEELFSPGREIAIVDDASDVVRALTGTNEDERIAMGERARARALSEHTSAHRVDALEGYVREALDAGARSRLGSRGERGGAGA